MPLEPTDPLVQSTCAAALRDVTVAIDSGVGAKKNRSVWLISEDGSQILIALRPTPLWRVYEGQRVHVTGAYVEPEGPQSLGVQHFRVDTLLIADQQATTDPMSFGRLQSLTGTWGVEGGQPGTKSQGSSWPTFSTEGGLTYQVMNPPVEKPAGRVTIQARAVTRSPCVAHRGGPTLWVVSDALS